MTTLLYNGTFEGLLTAVFEVFEYRFDPAEIISKEKYQSQTIFTDHHEVFTNVQKAERVENKLKKNLGKKRSFSIVARLFIRESRSGAIDFVCHKAFAAILSGKCFGKFRSF
jgi:hypothetical protein